MVLLSRSTNQLNEWDNSQGVGSRWISKEYRRTLGSKMLNSSNMDFQDTGNWNAVQEFGWSPRCKFSILVVDIVSFLSNYLSATRYT
jgi:hypothetical protein